MKKCVRCAVYKPLGQYAPNGKTRKGTQKYRSQCRDCESIRQYSLRKNLPNTKRYTWSDRKNHQLRAKFGMTFSEWVDLMESRGWSCEICGRTTESSGRTLAVDHCHSTGRIRGVLCQRCNCAIGLLAENSDSIRNALKYLGGL